MKYITLAFFVSVLIVSKCLSEKLDIPCLGKIPEEMSKAFVDCKAPMPGRSKRKSPPATEPLMPKSYLTSTQYKAGECICNQVQVFTSKGVDSERVRRMMDAKENYPMGAKQVQYWKKVKQCGFKASDYRKSADDQKKFFISCCEEEYRSICS